ncbi:MAG: ThuA domain-containing protein [Robiginitalea sp.]|uniref:ThuA domain-containing protein n=1 Tax=Robiginitalea sp. TaxID=1902411 RepID=UPI003C78C2E4
MKPLLLILFIILCSGLPEDARAQQHAASNTADMKHMLVYTNANGYRHASIETGVATIRDLAQQEGIRMDHTEDSLLFNENNLSKYQLVVFLSTTGDVLGTDQEKAFQKFVEEGGAFMGIHAATDTEYEWPWYGKLVGAYFESHPEGQQEAQLLVTNREHPATAHMSPTWKHYDEWYNFKNINPDIQVLMQLDEKSYEGGKNGVNHPIAWFHENAGGRAFYTGLGHDETTFKNPIFQEHLRGGLRYCLELE